MNRVRPSVVVLLPFLYLSVAFQLLDAFWAAGLGDWMDPSFINFLLEHWYRSASRLTDPLSPPMFFPEEGTLGYSHGLILYAPVYVAFRLFLHPFQAYNLTIFTVILIGVVCLYVIFRGFLRLTFVESLLVSAMFLSSPNVMDGSLGGWSQRASVFLVPAIILAGLASRSMPPGVPRMIAAFGVGLLATLLYTQDFYTAHFAALFAGLAGLAALLLGRRRAAGVLEMWRAERSALTIAAVLVTSLAGMWTLMLVTSGGGGIELAGLTLTSRNWRRPAGIVLAGMLFLVWRRRHHGWLLALLTGAFVGGCVFLVVYLDAYRTHRAFPDDHVVNQLTAADLPTVQHLWAFLGAFRGYESLRTFALVLVLSVATWIPRWRPDMATRLSALAALLVSLLVLAIPFRFGDFSIWQTVVAPLPGFSVIRDPKRIIYLYELAVALGLGWWLSRLASRSVLRRSASVLVLLLIVVRPHLITFDFLRFRDAFAQWIEAPVQIDASCQSFFIKPASPAYADRPNIAWTTYHLDAMWAATRYSIPTLNGYSAWNPLGYGIGNPHDPGYERAVAQWSKDRSLRGVCAFDIEKRTMVPWSADQ